MDETDERLPWARAAIEGSPLPIRFDDNAIVARYVDSECAAVLWIFDATADYAHLDDEVHWGKDLIVCDRTPTGDLERFTNVLSTWHGPPGDWPPETFSVGYMGISGKRFAMGATRDMELLRLVRHFESGESLKEEDAPTGAFVMRLK
jgi:hypothetical protein